MTAPIASMNTVREWAKERLSTGEEPPWSYYRLMQVVDAIDNIQASLAATKTADSPQSDGPPDEPRQTSAEVHQLKTAPRLPEGTEVTLPM